MITSSSHLYQLVQLHTVMRLFLFLFFGGDFVELEGFINGGTASPFMSAAPLEVALTRTVILFTWTIVISSGCFFGLDLAK